MKIITHDKPCNNIKCCDGCRYLVSEPWGRLGERMAYICSSTHQQHPQRVLRIIPCEYADRIKVETPAWCSFAKHPKKKGKAPAEHQKEIDPSA